jgi:hypothetical protein
MPDATIQEVWEKDCDCKGTSSGPRQAIQFEPYVAGEPLRFTATWCRIVCDVCEKPWRKANAGREADVHESSPSGGL